MAIIFQNTTPKTLTYSLTTSGIICANSSRFILPPLQIFPVTSLVCELHKFHSPTFVSQFPYCRLPGNASESFLNKSAFSTELPYHMNIKGKYRLA